MAKGQSRSKIGFVCTACKSRNYTSEKNKINAPEPLQMHKYCKKCKKATSHKESKDLD